MQDPVGVGLLPVTPMVIYAVHIYLSDLEFHLLLIFADLSLTGADRLLISYNQNCYGWH